MVRKEKKKKITAVINDYNNLHVITAVINDYNNLHVISPSPIISHGTCLPGFFLNNKKFNGEKRKEKK